MAGRKPKPTHLKLLAGNPGGRPLNKDEPIPEGDLNLPPDWLTESQKMSWQYAIENAPAGLLKKIDGSTLTAWVVAEDLHKQATIALKNLVYKDDKGQPKKNPFINIINDQAKIMIRAAAEMGFTPSSRSKVTVFKSDKATNRFLRNGK